MAITAAKTLSGFSGFLNAEQSGPIFEDAATKSAIMQLVPQHPLGIGGSEIPVVTERPKAAWVNEAAEKGKTQGGMELVTMAPKKLAAIAVMSDEVVRANPGGYVTWLRPALAEAFAIAFDFAALHNRGGDGTGTGPFDLSVSGTTKSVTLGTGTTLHNDLVSAGKQLAEEGRKLTGFAFSDYAEWLFMDEVDGVNRPLYNAGVSDPSDLTRKGTLVGRPCYLNETVGIGTTLGYAGDWNKARWGVIGGINFSVSNEATVTINGSLTSLWEKNLVAVRAEAEYGFVMTEADNFVKFVSSGTLGTLGTPGFGTP